MKGGNSENMHFADQNQIVLVAITSSCLFLGIASQNSRKTIVKGPVGGKITFKTQEKGQKWHHTMLSACSRAWRKALKLANQDTPTDTDIKTRLAATTTTDNFSSVIAIRLY